MDSVGNPCLGQVRGRCIFLDARRLCTLQPLDMKPMACKMWPFTVDKKPGCEEALFQYKGEDYHVYVDRSYPCPGIGKGDPVELHWTISELVEIQHNLLKKQIFYTSTHGMIPQLMRDRIRENVPISPALLHQVLQPPA
jgi:Fe-S-cluster containining protein